MPATLSYFMEALEAAHGWDYALTVAVSAIGGFVSIIVYLLKKRLEAYDKHLVDCNSKAVAIGKTEEKVAAVERRAEQMSTTMQWIGDCMITVGTKLQVVLPARPYHDGSNNQS